ncbi:YbaB/EbfC family nucleoid-associated protein [Candidatus Woesebacteria bacterium]|nr:YbaB/EbfC family nucleoid-associated protein [Candidatus Woesebacteria bacterium]
MAFDKIKQLNELRKLQSQAKSLQRELEQIKETVEYGDIRVTVSGDQKVLSLAIDGEERKDLVDAINKALKEVQKKAAKKMMEMGGGLSGLLGGMK